MPLLTDDARKSAKPALNILWTIFMVCFVVSIGCKFALNGWPGYLSWLEEISTLVIVLGLGAIGYLVARKNPLVK
jgi:CHASE2 domain-containing sensor protein